MGLVDSKGITWQFQGNRNQNTNLNKEEDEVSLSWLLETIIIFLFIINNIRFKFSFCVHNLKKMGFWLIILLI